MTRAREWRGGLAVIVPAQNEAQVIGATLASIAAAARDADVFVFCDASTDDTAAIARDVLPNALVIEHAANIGKSRGIQYVLDAYIDPERYRYVAVIDADTSLRPDFFDEAIPVLARRRTAAVTGQVKSRRYANPFAVYRMFVYAVWQALFKRVQSLFGAVVIASGCSTVWRTGVLRQVEFDHRMSTEDFNLTMQVHRKRLGAIRYVSSAVVWTQDPFTLHSYCRQSYRWSRAFWEAMRRYRVGASWVGVRRHPLRPSMLDLGALLLIIVVVLYGVALFAAPVLVAKPIPLDLRVLTLDTRAEYGLWLGMQYTLIGVLILLTGLEARRPWIVFYTPLMLLLIYVDLVISAVAFLAVSRSLYRRGAAGTSSAWTSPARQPVSPRNPIR